MKEDKYFRIFDIVEEMLDKDARKKINKDIDVTKGWFPTVEELKSHNVEENISKYFELLYYFALDPFKTLDNPDKDIPEYKATVKYCSYILRDVNPEDIKDI